jgi:hypothetical protein
MIIYSGLETFIALLECLHCCGDPMVSVPPRSETIVRVLFCLGRLQKQKWGDDKGRTVMLNKIAIAVAAASLLGAAAIPTERGERP